MPSEAKMRTAQLPVHSQNYSSLRKRSFKSACRRAVAAQQPVSYRGQQLTPVQVRRSGNCPPRHSGRGSGRPPRQRAGLAISEFFLGTPGAWVSNSGPRSSLGYRQRPSRSVTFSSCRRHTGRPPHCFPRLAGTAYRQLRRTKPSGALPNLHPLFPRGLGPTNPAPSAKSLRGSKGPSTTKADGVMVLLSPEIPTNTVRWRLALIGMVPGPRSWLSINMSGLQPKLCRPTSRTEQPSLNR